MTAENSLTDHRHLLKIAFLSVYDSCRSDAVWLWIICGWKAEPYQHNNNDDVYDKYLLYEAEQFFNERAEELTEVSINR